MFSALMPLHSCPLLSQPVYAASVSCFSGVSNAFTERKQKASAMIAATTKAIIAEDEVQEFKVANDVHMVDFTEAADGNENHEVDELQVRMEMTEKLMKKFDEKLKEKQATDARVRRRAGDTRTAHLALEIRKSLGRHLSGECC